MVSGFIGFTDDQCMYIIEDIREDVGVLWIYMYTHFVNMQIISCIVVVSLG